MTSWPSAGASGVSELYKLLGVQPGLTAVTGSGGKTSLLRQLAREHSVIMDGRDIGTVVLPEAQVKVFLTASAEARAQRRVRELEQRGTPQPYAQVLEEIRQRDYNDTHRAAAPLRQAEDAVVLDTTELNFQESEEALLCIIRKKLEK